MITTGVLGHVWRGSIAPWGGLRAWPAAGDPAIAGLDWYIAADDRWHVPVDEPTVRQTRLEGSAVTETRVRVPRGDVVQYVYSVADGGGLTIVEVVNESTLPVAIAFSRRDLLTERPIGEAPIAGIELPAGSCVMPLGHQASLRVALDHHGGGPGPLPGGLPTAAQVSRGWLALTERASRMVLPDGELGSSIAARVTAERCEVALGATPAAVDDPAAYAVAVGEVVRMGEQPEPWLPELVEVVALLAVRRSWEADAGLAAAARVLAAADERRAMRDLARIVAGRSASERPPTPPIGPLAIAWLESRLVSGGDLLPTGFPDDWLGRSIEVYGMPTSPRSTVSYAVRWHGARPAVLWEQTGDAVELSAPVVAPGWRTTETKGEALWPEPSGRRTLGS